MQHKLLVRQIRRALGVTSERDLQHRLEGLRTRGEAQLADGLEALFEATERSYQQYDRDLLLRTRMLEISSDELTGANDQLRREAARQREVLLSLQASVQHLTDGSVGAPSDQFVAGDFDGDLLRLTHALEQLVKQREQAREQLAAAEAANRRILDNLREVVFQTDLRGRWVYLNPAWANITGWSVTSSLGRRAVSFLHPQDMRANRQRLRHLVGRQQNDMRQQMRFRAADGHYCWLEVIAARIVDEHGQVVGLSGSLIDITEQKLTQDQLIVSEERLNQALLATNSRLWDWDLSQSQPYVDPAWLVNLGYAADDPVARDVRWDRQLHPEDLALWRVHLREHVRRERAELDIELRFVTARGEWRYASLRGKVVQWEGKRALRVAGMLQDISARKQAEQAALRQQELTEQILDQLPIPVFLKDREGRFLRINRQYQRVAQRPRAAMLGRLIDEFAGPEWASMVRTDDAQAWSTGQMVTSERRLAITDPPVDYLANRIVIHCGSEAYLLGYLIDISEQRAAREAMQRAVESAEAASRAKSAFLANMSHEIRTPMNGILGVTELVLESELGAEQREDLLLVKASGDALLTIINDILDFSKIEAGKLAIEEVPFDLRKLASETVRSMALRAHQKGLGLVCELPPNLPVTVKGDPGRLRQVLINLLGNAIKFTEFGTITLALRAGCDQGERCDILFSVRDTGIGIPREKQQLIFEAFSQVDGSTTRQYDGTGLGLTICRRLVILMQGQIDVTSEPGVGSTFSFTVPLRQSGMALSSPLPISWLHGKLALLADANVQQRGALAAQLVQAGMQVRECDTVREVCAELMGTDTVALLVLDAELPDIDAVTPEFVPRHVPVLLIEARPQTRVVTPRCTIAVRLARPLQMSMLIDHLLDLFADSDATPLVLAGEALEPVPTRALADEAASAGRMRILLAEDNPVNQRLALRLLEKMGYRAALVDNGLAALERATSEPFDLILLDVQMPGLDGLSVARHIRQWEATHGGHVPIIAMTARAISGDREECLEAGMDDYLSKPIDSKRLRQLVAQFEAEAQEPVLSWRDALLRLDGDADLLLELGAIFLDDGPVLFQELRQALASDDLATSQRTVHSIKGVLVNFGAERAIACSERLEACLQADRPREQWLRGADELAPALDDVYAGLRELIATGAQGMRGA